MTSSINRRTFFAATSGSCLALPLALTFSTHGHPHGQDAQPTKDSPLLPPGFPSHDPALVSEVVGKSHFDLETVTKLVEARPALAKAVWDWGFGDWESALGAASHVGRHDIAEVLIAHGARADIFTFAMFGELDAVKSIVAANPGIQRIPGPHGITLLAHAEAGGEQASQVLTYLQSLGDADQVAINLPLDPQVHSQIIGQYQYEFPATDVGAKSPFSCEIIEQKNGGLAFRHLPDGSRRNLLYEGSGHFHPAGAPSVRITFAEARLTIEDGSLRVTARKV